MYQRASSTIAHLKEVAEYCKRLGVGTKLYINPLNSLKEGFYTGGILFSCLYDKKMKDVFAAGGRYDHLIREQRPNIGGQAHERHAVGFSLAWERLARIPKQAGRPFLKKNDEDLSGLWGTKRVSSPVLQDTSGPVVAYLQRLKCDILVASFDPAILRSVGVGILQSLWAHDISAELARDSRSPEDLMSKHRDESYWWMVIIKQDAMLKIKTVGRRDVPDADVAAPELLSWLRAEMRERDSKMAVKMRATSSQVESFNSGDTRREQDVSILVGQSRSKKFNRRTVVEQAQVKAAGLMETYLDGPILAVESINDQVMEAIERTKLSDQETWRKVEYAVSTSERKYVRDIHEQLDSWRLEWTRKGRSRHSFVYNFRTGYCLHYDLAA